MRWQIYGPHKIGLGLCDQHRNIPALGDDQILYQVVAATAMRKLAEPRSRQDLPSLQSVHHILLKARNRAYGIPAINQLFTTLTALTGRGTRLENTMSEMLGRHAQYRQANIERDQSEKQQGLPIFERLKLQLRATGMSEIADQLTFSDYRPKTRVIYVRLPEMWRGRMIGKGGTRIKQLGEAIGAKIDFERG
jgi:hypothetical protein